MLWHTLIAKTVANANGKPFQLFNQNSNLFNNRIRDSSDTETLRATTAVTRVGTSGKAALFEEQDPLAFSKKVNNGGKVLYILVVVAFNLIFWSIALLEYFRPAEDYI